MLPIILFAVALVVGYLLGSVNTSIVVGKAYGIEIRNHGSGNAGMTNTLRTMGKLPAVIVIIGDMIKGILACIIGAYILPSLLGFANAGLLAAGIGALLGHNWPVFFGFKGGKGVLTTFSVILMSDYRIGLVLLAIFVIVVAFSRYISLGSCVTAIAFPAIVFFMKDYFKTNLLFVAFAAIVAILVIIKHRENIVRLYNGKENKFSLKKKQPKEG